MSTKDLEHIPSGYLSTAWQRRCANATLIVVLVTIGRWCRALQEGGHDWGDDFALYIRQAQALAGGYVGQVTGDTHFALRHSGWPFTPEAYPWGWPLVMMPVVARWGVDYSKLKLLVTLVFLVFLLLFHTVCRRRMGEIAALLMVMAIGVNYFFISWTNNVLSEFPFMAAMMLVFLAFDRYQRSGSLWNNSRRPAIGLGLALALAANIRREGYALPLGIVVAHGIEFLRPMPSMRSSNSHHRLNSLRSFVVSSREFLRRAYIPYAVLLAALLGWQILLPSDLLPNSRGVKPQNFSENARWYHGIVAEHLGLKDPGDTPFRFGTHSNFGDATGPLLLRILLIASVVGLVLRFWIAPREDGWLIGSLAGVAYVVFAAPFHDGRYFYVLSPWVLYFAVQSIPGAFELVRRVHVEPDDRVRRASRSARIAYTLRCVLLGLVIWSNWPSTSHAINYHRKYAYVENGPESPDSKDMFAAVERLVPTNDVILFFRSRAMMLYTERRSVQHTDIMRMRTVAQWYMMERNSSYGQTLIQGGEEQRYGVEKAWENNRWILWRFVPMLRPTP